jgi:hypothetical protein
MLFNPATAIYAEYWLNYRRYLFCSVAILSLVRDRSELQSVIAAQAREPMPSFIRRGLSRLAQSPRDFFEAQRREREESRPAPPSSSAGTTSGRRPLRSSEEFVFSCVSFASSLSPYPASLSSAGKRSATRWSARAASAMGPNGSSPSRKQEPSV